MVWACYANARSQHPSRTYRTLNFTARPFRNVYASSEKKNKKNEMNKLNNNNNNSSYCYNSVCSSGGRSSSRSSSSSVSSDSGCKYPARRLSLSSLSVSYRDPYLNLSPGVSPLNSPTFGQSPFFNQPIVRQSIHPSIHPSICKVLK